MQPQAGKPKSLRDRLLVKLDEGKMDVAVSRHPLRTLFYVTAAIVVLASISIFFIEVDRVVAGRGQTVAAAPKYALRPLNKAIVREVKVRVGQVVRPGDALVILDPTSSDADVRKLGDKMKSYDAEVQRLKAHVSGSDYPRDVDGGEDELMQKANFESERQEYRSNLRKLDEKVQQLSAYAGELGIKETHLTQQAEAAKKVFDMWDELVNQHDFGAKTNLYKAQGDFLSLQAQLAEVRGARKKTGHELKSAQAERDAYVKEWQAKKYESLSKATRDYRDARQEFIKSRTENEMVTLVAKEEAVVLEIGDFSVGSVVSPNDTLLKMVPASEPAEVEIQVSGTDVAFLKVGQEARIKLDALPFQKHGVWAGTIRTISRDSFRSDTRNGKGDRLNQEATAQMDATGRIDPYYLVRVEFKQPELRSVPETFRLLPGMALSADIKVGSRKLSEYLLFPILRGLDESLREP